MTFEMPYVDVDVAFTSGSTNAQYLLLDDPVRGKLDVGKLAPGSSSIGGELFEPVGAYVSALSINQGATRLDGPLVRYETGNANVTFRNEDRRFDPTNLDGPYVVGSGVPTTGVQTFQATKVLSYGHAFTVNVKSHATLGPAELLSVSPHTTGTSPTATVTKPAGLASGMILIAFHSADFGSLADMGTPTGGATWLPLGDMANGGTNTLKTKVWWKVTTATDVSASNYGFTQNSGADGVITLALIRFADTTVTPIIQEMSNDGLSLFSTPSTTPAGTDDYELRWVGGAGGGSGLNWQQAAGTIGFTEWSDLQSGVYTTGALFGRALTDVGQGETQITPMRAIRALVSWGSQTNQIRNPMFQDDSGGVLDGWQSGAGATVTLSSDRAYLGGYSAKVAMASGTVHAIESSSAGYFNVAENLPVTVSAWVYIPDAVFSKLDGIGVTDATFDGAIPFGFVTMPDVSNRWYRIQYTTTTASFTQLRGIQIQFWTDGTVTAGTTVAYVDGVQVVVGSVPERVTFPFRRYPLFRGFVDHWEVNWSMENGPLWSEVVTPCSDAFTYFTNYPRVAQDAIVGTGENSGARINRILDNVGWPAEDREISTGDSTLQGTTHDGDALGEMQQVADAEIGELYMSGSGKVVFRNREAILTEERSTTPQWVFGDDTDNPQELPWQDLIVSYDSSQLYNLVEEAMVGGDVQSVQDVISRQRNLTRPFSRSDLLLQTNTAVLGHANWILAMSKDPELRFDALVINAYRDPYRLFPAVLSIRIGDRLRIIRRPPDQGAGTLPIIRDVIVRGISHAVGQVRWETTFQLQSATKYANVVNF